MAQSTGLQFTVKVGALADSTFAVASFKLDEGLNRPFNLHLEVASQQPDIDFGAVLDQPCELLVWYNGELQRRICGVVSEFAQGDSGFRRTRYSIEVKPALWRLGLRQNSRIFQAQKPDEILSILLQEHGITDYAFALKNEHAQREYCVQYRETDLDFVNRLAAEEGLFYFHEFEAGKHRIVFADDAAALTQGPELFFNLGNRSLEQGPYVRQFHYRESVRPSDVELKDYSFKTPAYGLSQKKMGAELEHQRNTYQHFDYPGRYKQDGSGKAFAQHRLDALRNDAVAGSGKSNSAALLPGQHFSLTEHPNGSLNTDWQIVNIRHTGEQPQALEEEGGSGPTVYHNEFGVVKASTTWRARIGSPEAPHKPMVDGPQIAIVVGPEGEEIYCDEHGRVKLQFPWDRYGSSNDQSSCWVRVSQGWAGGQYGMMAIPRVGHEVIVSFLEGDPDQPIVTGRTNHATNRPPYELPANKTRTVLRTETHQGEGFNELRFEDQAGQEEIYIHGQKDLNVLIENDAAWHIKHDEHRDIDNERVTRIKANDHLTVEGEKREHIKVTSGDLCLTDPEQPLPEGHKAGQAQPPRFITKHSYVIEVKGYQLNILRIGVFFDGTANNTTKHEEGKAALEAFLAQCSDPLEQERMRQQCMAGEVSFRDTSQANDVTNIGKAYELYQLPQQGRLTVRVYIDGIGTESGQGDLANNIMSISQ